MHQQGIDTTTPAGKAMFQMMGVFAEMLQWLRAIKMDRLAVQIAGSILLQRYMILKPRHRSTAVAHEAS